MTTSSNNTGSSLDSPREITLFLRQWSSGERDALNKLFPLAYERLRQIAGYLLSGNMHSTVLQPTALVNEAYMKLSTGDKTLRFENRQEFFRFSGRVMRFVLVEYARHNLAKKRGGSEKHVSLDALPQVELSDGQTMDLASILALDGAMAELEKLDPRSAMVIELRFFAGMNNGEIAKVMELSTSTVKRELSSAKCWLMRELK